VFANYFDLARTLLPAVPPDGSSALTSGWCGIAERKPVADRIVAGLNTSSDCV